MIRFLKDLIPKPIVVRADSKFEELRDQLRWNYDQINKAFTALPKVFEKELTFNTDSLPITISTSFFPAKVDATRITQNKQQIQFGNCHWTPSSSGKDIILLGIVGLNSNTEYVVNFLITGKDEK